MRMDSYEAPRRRTHREWISIAESWVSAILFIAAIIAACVLLCVLEASAAAEPTNQWTIVYTNEPFHDSGDDLSSLAYFAPETVTNAAAAKIETRELRTCRKRAMCPCGGEFIYQPLHIMFNDPFKHKCNKCSLVVYLDRAYPCITYEEAEK